ncbi:dihydrofolate reductase [Vibrio owensii]|uniref:dihydrofolate reductase n=1 Tax=Vibrio owensii TaxID=696485 RepID=UPI0018F1C601
MNISLVVAYDKMKGIGKNNQLLWSLPADMEWFRLITTGKPVIMGKNTYRSIGKPLKDRTNIVLTSDLDFEEEGVLVAASIEEAIHLAGESVEVLIIGGESVFKQFIEMADTLYITEVDAHLEADTFFPDWGKGFTRLYSNFRERDDENEYDMSFNIYKRNAYD